MRYIVVTCLSILIASTVFGQIIPDAYLNNIAKADSCLESKQFLQATIYYNQAFMTNNNLGRVRDRYSDAKCWTVLDNKDSAFFQLDKIANGGKFTKYQILENDLAFLPLRSDPRWAKIISTVKSNTIKTLNN